MEEKFKESYKYKLDLPELEFKPSSEKSAKISCPSCDAQVPVKDINIHDHIGKCGQCNTVFSIETQIEHLKQKSKNELLKKPKGLEVFKFGNEVEFSLNQPLNILEVLGVTLIPFLAIVLTIPWLTKSASYILPLTAWSVAILFILNVLTLKWQKLYFIIDKRRKKFDVIRKPRKLYRNTSYDLSEIVQFYVSKPADYALTMVLNTPNGHKHINLVTGYKKVSEVRYLEQELEEHLGIENKTVPEEVT